MKFTFTEWKNIRHNMEVAAMTYDRQMNESKESTDPHSMYQIFKRQAEETRRLIQKIDTSEV